MSYFRPRALGWRPSIEDFRDFAPSSAPSQMLFEMLRASGARAAQGGDAVDLSEYFVEVDDQLDLPTSPAHAAAALVEYFERRATGRLLRPSRLFIHHNAQRFAGGPTGELDLRSIFKAMVRCGVPAERFWPYEPNNSAQVPEPFMYCFSSPYRSVRYMRVAERGTTGPALLEAVKAFLAAGFPLAFGFPVPVTVSANSEIPFRPSFDSILGGQAVVVVGYDNHWLGSSRGALRFRNSWGADWGDSGYGWLPYAFVEAGLVSEFWTVLHPEWMTSGEFDLPDLPR